MPRSAHAKTYDAHLTIPPFLPKALWSEQPDRFSFLSWNDQLALHKYYPPSLDTTELELIAHRGNVQVADPSLPPTCRPCLRQVAAWRKSERLATVPCRTDGESQSARLSDRDPTFVCSPRSSPYGEPGVGRRQERSLGQHPDQQSSTAHVEGGARGNTCPTVSSRPALGTRPAVSTQGPCRSARAESSCRFATANAARARDRRWPWHIRPRARTVARQRGHLPTLGTGEAEDDS